MLRIILTILLILPVSAYAEPTLLSTLIDNTYDFHPHKLTKQEKKEKSKLLDAFWNKVKSDQDKYLPMLRTELSNTNHLPFFYFNGGTLLLSTSETKSDRFLFLSNISKVNLKDIDNTYYLRLIFSLGRQGYDTSDAALHLLSNPDFKAFIWQHSLTLGLGWSLTISLIPQNEEFYLKKVINNLLKDKANPHNKHLIYVLWYADSPEALSTLQDVAEDSAYTDKVTKLAKELIKIDSTILTDLTEEATARVYKTLMISPDLTYAQLKKFRQKQFTNISDERLIDYKKINSLMKRKRIALEQ